MKRPRFHIIVAFSVLFLSLGEWVHSQYRGNALTDGRQTNNGTQILGAASECGQIVFFGGTEAPNLFTGFKPYSQPAQKAKFANNTSFIQKLGFAFHADATGGWLAEIPWWFISLIAAASLLNTSIRQRRAIAKQRLASCHCLRCGYDLRSSPDRCPECGTPAPKHRPLPSPA